MNSLERRNRAKGMIWGLVVGDCLGSPIQFTQKYNHPHITDIVPCPVFDLPAGYWTDDGSMAMCIMESFTRLKKIDIDDIANNFARWYKDGFLSSVEGRSFDVGTSTAEACYGIILEKKTVNGNPKTQGNGSIMRFAPSYLAAEGSLEMMKRISDITHASPAVRDVVEKFKQILDDHMNGIKTSLESEYKTKDEVNNSGWAVSTLEAALWAFNSTSSFEDCLIEAVNLGGDSDTIGAVAGQIAGAFYGYSSIPEKWISKVKDFQKVDKMIEDFLDSIGI